MYEFVRDSSESLQQHGMSVFSVISLVQSSFLAKEHCVSETVKLWLHRRVLMFSSLLCCICCVFVCICVCGCWVKNWVTEEIGPKATAVVFSVA